jgi:Pyruvate/2-oxoacid:ferredoxin oxidoreductase delta subunit
MPIRKIITIDEEKCTGCGHCVTGCAEGALQIVDGKAKLVKEQFCDGFGDCVGECPEDALRIEERECEDFSIDATKQHLMQTGGTEAVRRMEQANLAHDRGDHPDPPRAQPPPGGCPGSRMRAKLGGEGTALAAVSSASLPAKINDSGLDQWPIQLHLVQPGAPFFSNRELVVLSTCSPIASADVHWRFIRGRGVVVACPKLDNTGPYAEKLGQILKDTTIPKVIVVRMEVPCCGGLSMLTRRAVELSGRSDLEFEEVVVGLQGDVM